MGWIKELIELAYYYKKDGDQGVPYWKDTTLIGLAVGILCAALAKYAGLDVDSGLQLKIVGVITGIGALLSPHTGIKPLPEKAKSSDDHNPTAMS